MTLKFEPQSHSSSIIKVIGVGGGGSNAVSHMYNQGIRGVDFILCNTDKQALEVSPVPVKIQLGSALTDGMGAGSIPDVGKKSAIESIEELKEMLKNNTKMVFITAGMGGGTGTGAAPVIASVAKELGILTVGIVTIPFMFEGRKRKLQAEQGIEELRNYVDTLLIICNDKLRELYGNLKLCDAFRKADDILTTAAKGIAEIITVTGYINVDFNDVNTVMRNSGAALMGTGIAEGENRAITAVEMALSSPLLNDNDITGAQNILLYISSGNQEITMDEVTEITDYIQSAAGLTAEIIWGNGIDESLENNISVTLIATGFNTQIAKEHSDMGKKVNELEKPVEKIPEPKPVEEDVWQITKIPADHTEVSAPLSITPDNQEEENKKIIFPLDTETTASAEPKTTDPISVSSVKPEPVEMESTFNDHYSSYSKSEHDEQAEVKKSISENDLQVRHNERVEKLKAMSVTLKSSEDLEKLEKEPAYMRRNVTLINTNPSSESEVSKYTLGDDDKNGSELKPNSFLHDNVD